MALCHPTRLSHFADVLAVDSCDIFAQGRMVAWRCCRKRNITAPGDPYRPDVGRLLDLYVEVTLMRSSRFSGCWSALIYLLPHALIGLFAVLRGGGSAVEQCAILPDLLLPGHAFQFMAARRPWRKRFGALDRSGRCWFECITDRVPASGFAPFGCALLLYLAIKTPLRFRLLEFFGNVSYSLYLLHAIVGYDVMLFANTHGYSPWTASSLGVALSLAMAVLSYLLIERPTIAFGKALVKRGTKYAQLGSTVPVRQTTPGSTRD